MSPEEKTRIAARVLEVIEKDFHDDFTDMLGMAVQLTESIPEQVNNEIRNAITHLARAYTHDDFKGANEEIDRAVAHIERGKRDCLKLSIIEVQDRVKNSALFVEQKYGLTIARGIRRELLDLTVVRGSIFKDESKGDKQTSTRLEELLTKYIDLDRHVIENFSLPGKKVAMCYRCWWTAVKFLGPLLTGFIIALLIAIIVLLIEPDGMEALARGIINWGKSLYQSFTAANTPSTGG